MGFWQTGYREFHESTGLEIPPDAYKPKQYQCSRCDFICDSEEDLRQHRFEKHPFSSPKLWLKGREVGSEPFKVTSPLEENDIQIYGCTKGIINNKNIEKQDIPEALMSFVPQDCIIELTLCSDSGVQCKFKIEFSIANNEDILGIEDAFDKLLQGSMLNRNAIDKFITTSQKYQTAYLYCNGICEYLYGVLAKEEDKSSNLPFEKYEDKYNKAANDLSSYDRKLARAIRGVIGFHFNHFEEILVFSSDLGVGFAARQCVEETYIDATHCINSRFDECITEYTTEKIIKLSMQSLERFYEKITDLEAFVSSRKCVEYDKIKLHMLLAKVYLQYKEQEKHDKHFKELRRFPKILNIVKQYK